MLFSTKSRFLFYFTSPLEPQQISSWTHRFLLQPTPISVPLHRVPWRACWCLKRSLPRRSYERKILGDPLRHINLWQVQLSGSNPSHISFGHRALKIFDAIFSRDLSSKNSGVVCKNPGIIMSREVQLVTDPPPIPVDIICRKTTPYLHSI